MKNRKIIIILLLMLLGKIGFSQVWQLRLQLLPSEKQEFNQAVNSPNDTLFKSKEEIYNKLQKTILTLYSNGYYAASADTIIEDSLIITAKLNLGKKLKWIALKNYNIPSKIIANTGFKERLFRNKLYNNNQVKNLFNKLLNNFQNSGYPFAKIWLDSVKIDTNNSVAAGIYTNTGPLLIVDSILFYGAPKVSNTFVKNHIKIKEGDVYNEKLILESPTRIKEIAFLQETKPKEVFFVDDNSITLKYFLKEKKASSFSGIIGFLPNTQSQKLLLTGDIRLKLQNALKQGEIIDFNWRKLQNNTQDLKTNFNYPFLFNTPFGIDVKFKLYKRDTLFSNAKINLGVQYLLRGGNYLKAYVERQTANLISKTQIQSQQALTNAPYKTTLYGLEFKHSQYDYRFNPQKGFGITLSAGVGSKKIKLPPDNENITLDTIALNSTFYRIKLDADWYQKLIGRTIFKARINVGLLNNKTIFKNELYRIGGLKTLRGFDEESINASIYSVFTGELRYILEQNSYAFLFVDYAYYEIQQLNVFNADRPYGFGFGITFATKAGIFTIDYALGKQFSNPIEFRSAKIHFGFVNFF